MPSRSTATWLWPRASTHYYTTPGGRIDKVFDNCFVLRFDTHGRCREFTEWFMQCPGGQ